MADTRLKVLLPVASSPEEVTSVTIVPILAEPLLKDSDDPVRAVLEISEYPLPVLYPYATW